MAVKEKIGEGGKRMASKLSGSGGIRWSLMMTFISLLILAE